MSHFNFIVISENSRVPKYRQIVESIRKNIASGKLKIGEKVPSINALSEEFYLSRDTVEKAYKILKEKNIIVSVRGKGYYINRTELIAKTNVLFFMNKLSNYKMKIYNSFINQVNGTVHTDLQIYHCEEALFLNLLNKNKEHYDFFIVMPHFRTADLRHVDCTHEIEKALNQIPKDKLLLLDNDLPMAGQPPAIYQDFENDIYQALIVGNAKIASYKKLFLVYPEQSVYPYPKGILLGFRKFCFEFNYEFEILDELYEDIILKKGDLFILIEEADLVSLIKRIRGEKFVIGEDVGIISYNDTPLKELLDITVISTDFIMMGEMAANFVLNKRMEKVKNPFNFIDRKSI